MTEKVIGVLGGMGPAATLSFYEKLIANTSAATDQEHLRVVIESNPKVPDRTAALLGQGPSPVPLMAAGVEALARAGADFVVIPCVSAHAFLAELREQIRLPVLSMLDVTADNIRQASPRIDAIGLLATTGTLEAGLFQDRLTQAGLRTIVPAAADQRRVMKAIYDIKGAGTARQRAALGRDLRSVGETLVDGGAQGVVLGCTELPLALGPGDLNVPVFDSVLLLARAAITEAGREPLERRGSPR